MKTTRLILVFFCVLLLSCKSRYFRASSVGMENTIMAGQNFFVQPAKKFGRDDIVVFNYYGNDYSSPAEEPETYKQHWEKRVYRLIAYSGDIIEIKDGEILVNERRAPLPPLAKVYYEIRSSVSITDFSEQESYAVNFQKKGDTIIYRVALTVGEAEDYRQRKPAILSVRRTLMENITSDTVFARLSSQNHWTQDNYGPLKIPSPGELVIVNAGNYKLFKNIPDIRMGNNTIKEKLYFVLGDNRYGAEDSRYIGLISHSNMYGTVR